MKTGVGNIVRYREPDVVQPKDDDKVDRAVDEELGLGAMDYDFKALVCVQLAVARGGAQRRARASDVSVSFEFTYD